MRIPRGRCRTALAAASVGKKFQDLEERVSEAIHDSETRLLKAFYTFVEIESGAPGAGGKQY